MELFLINICRQKRFGREIYGGKRNLVLPQTGPKIGGKELVRPQQTAQTGTLS